MEDTKRKLATFVQRVKAETNTSYSVLKASVSSSALAGLADSVRHKTRSLLAANGREADHYHHYHSDKKQQPRKAKEEPVASSGDFDWDHEFEEDSGDSEQDYSAVDSGEGDTVSSPAWLRLDLQSREQAEQWLRRPGQLSGVSGVSSSGCPFVVRPAQRAGPQYPLCLSLLSRTDQVVYHLPVRCQQQQQPRLESAGGEVAELWSLGKNSHKTFTSLEELVQYYSGREQLVLLVHHRKEKVALRLALPQPPSTPSLAPI